MKYQLVVTPQARADIDRNADWWAAHHSVLEAVEWVRTVYSQLDDLEQFPQSCSLSQEHERFPFELRDKLVGKGSRRRYRAIFTIDGETVTVLTVRAAEEGDLNPSDLAAS